MPVIHMLTTAAGPDFILHAGKNYRVSKRISDPWVNGVPMQFFNEKTQELETHPTKLSGPFARIVTGPCKIEKVTRPDPGEIEVAVDEDDEDYGDE